MKAGLALTLKTPVSYVTPYVDQIDQLILVSCEADVEGLPFRPGVLSKVAETRALLPEGTHIWVDGGVNESNLRDVIFAGATGVVVGRAVFGNADPAAECKRLLELGRQFEKERDALAI